MQLAHTHHNAPIAPTPKDTIFRDGTAKLYRFRRPNDEPPTSATPVLVVPSMINRWYVVDLRPSVSLCGSLVEAGLDVFCLDWGVPEDEDRFLQWEDVLGRLARMMRRVQRETGVEKIAVLGYCMGATLAGVQAALEPESFAAFVNLAGPFDFSHGGLLAQMTHEDWFDADAIADAGNVAPSQMQSGFVALRPTGQVSKWVSLFDRMLDPEFRTAFHTLEVWTSDNIPFPAEAYRTYITELYQDNLLVQGKHHVAGRSVDLGRIDCPLLTIVAERDTICPPEAAKGLHDSVASTDRELIVVPGGHVGAVVGSRAPKVLYPAIAKWLLARAEARSEPRPPRAGRRGRAERLAFVAPRTPSTVDAGSPQEPAKASSRLDAEASAAEVAPTPPRATRASKSERAPAVDRSAVDRPSSDRLVVESGVTQRAAERPMERRSDAPKDEGDNKDTN